MQRSFHKARFAFVPVALMGATMTFKDKKNGIRLALALSGAALAMFLSGCGGTDRRDEYTPPPDNTGRAASAPIGAADSGGQTGDSGPNTGRTVTRDK